MARAGAKTNQYDTRIIGIFIDRLIERGKIQYGMVWHRLMLTQLYTSTWTALNESKLVATVKKNLN